MTVDNIIKTNRYRVALSSNVDSQNENVLNAFYEFHGIPERYHGNYDELTAIATDYLKNEILPRYNETEYVNSVGYWEGNINPNSVIILTTKGEAEFLVDNAARLLGQDAILAFGPDCTVEVFDQPEDYCTKVEDKWIRFNFDGDVLETKANVLTEAFKTYEVNDDYVVDDLVEIAYDAAKRVYYSKDWSDTTIDLDEFQQLAATYIFNKYQEGYFENDPAEKVAAKVVGMLKGYFVGNVFFPEIRRVNKLRSLNRSLDADTNDADEQLDLLADTNSMAPDELESLRMNIDYGKDLVESIIELLNPLPYKTRMHTYKAEYIPKLNRKNVELSEKVLGELILGGLSTADIVSIFTDVKPNENGKAYYSHDTKASYVAHKIADVTKTIANAVAQLDKEEQEAIRDYLENIANN